MSGSLVGKTGKVVHRIVDLREAERGSVISLYVGDREIQCIISFSIANVRCDLSESKVRVSQIHTLIEQRHDNY